MQMDEMPVDNGRLMAKKKLILMRHATAQPEYVGFNDRDRPLSGEGMQELERIRRKLQGHLQGLDVVLCSSVKRARQTLEGIKPILPSTCENAFNDQLYHASVETVLGCFRGLDSKVNFAMVIGHNPSLSYFLGLVNPPENSFSIPKMVSPASVAILEGNFKDWAEASVSAFKWKTFLIPD